jgi:protein phosphatase
MSNNEDSAGEPETAEPLPRSSSSGTNYASALVQVDLGAVTHRGYTRTNNEDHCLVVRFERSLKTLITNLPKSVLPSSFDEVGFGMLVADGMGGVAAGEVASTTAICKLVELAVSTPDWIMKLEEPDYVATVMQRMTERFRTVDNALRERAEIDFFLRGMGTTLTVALSLGAELLIGHIGDSRAYLLHDGELHQLTRDHTLAQEMIDAGVIHPTDKVATAMRRVLTAALGSTGERMDPQVQRLSLTDGDQVLLCSDGLTEMAKEEDIAAVLREADGANQSCHALVDLALRGGGLDNITVVLARYKFPPTDR